MILSGGPASVYETARRSATPRSFAWESRCWESATACNWPARRWAGKVDSVPSREYGRADLPVIDSQPICSPASPTKRGLDEPRRPGVGGIATISCRWPTTDTCPFAAVKHRELPVYGLQFHPEVTHTPEGARSWAIS